MEIEAAQKYVDELVARSKAAQKKIRNYNQKQVDRLVRICGKTIYDHAEELAAEAVEEGGLGNAADKIGKMKNSTSVAYQFLKDKKTVGIIGYDEELHIADVAKPIGVIGCLIPSTNPTSTVGGNGMYALKCRDSIIFSVHPRTKNVSVKAVNLVREALKAAGEPEDLFIVIEEPSMESTNALMQKADVVVATGGPAMVKAAYSSGRPSYGVGQGNVQVIIDEDCQEDYEYIAKETVNSRCRDNGLPCTGEQFIAFPLKDEEEVLAAFDKAGAYVVRDEETAAKIRNGLFQLTPKGKYAFNICNVGQDVYKIAKNIGIEIPEGKKSILVKVKSVGKEELLCKEKLCPVEACMGYNTFDEGMEYITKNLEMEGMGHSAVIYSHNEEHIERAGIELPVSRLIVNACGSTAGGNTLANGLAPTMSLGCGSWGNNSISENLSYKHLMNVTKIAYKIEDAVIPSNEEIWAE